jgi:hypothetical protein
MNDIDRSVEIFDFALRRRFAWQPLEVDHNLLSEVLSSILKPSPLWSTRITQLVSRAEKLNQKIKDRPSLGGRYAIGPAYFGKVKQYGEEEESAYRSLWEFHLHALVREYVHGNDDEDKFVAECEQSFLGSAINAEQDEKA